MAIDYHKLKNWPFPDVEHPRIGERPVRAGPAV